LAVASCRHRGAIVAGLDEVGRGPLAGPVVAAAVVLSSGDSIEGLDDSKRLSDRRRRELASVIVARAAAIGLGRAEVGEVDRYNVLNASLLAMERAVRRLRVVPDHVYVDGNVAPVVAGEAHVVVKGDGIYAEIAAASIIAKVARDDEMIGLDRIWPGYGFARHKGYPTAMHLNRLRCLGVSAVHRRSFGPVERVRTSMGRALMERKHDE